MTSTRTFCSAAACAALIAGVLPGTASAEETDCVGALGPVTVDNLRVPDGATCELDGTTVKGTVKVETGATLRARAVRVVGNIQAENAARAVVETAVIGGSVQVKQGGGAELTESVVAGDVQLDQNEGAAQRVADNDIGGSVQVMKNVGGVEISQNIIDGNLQCKENEPPPTGGGNDVHGNAEDECATLAGGSPDAGPGNGVTVARGSLNASRGVVAVPLRCAATRRCSGRVRLVSSGRGSAAQAAALLGSARFAIGADRSKAVRVRLSRSGRAALRRAKRLRIVVAVTNGGQATRHAVTLRR